MVKDKAKEHGLEYVILLKSDQEEEFWEIDYDKGLSLNVSEYMSLKIISQKSNVTRYYGRIEDFLKKERGCINIHYQESVAPSLLPTRIHIGKRGSGGVTEGCKFSIE